MRWTVLLFAAACVDEAPDGDPCVPGPKPTLTLGEGEEGYVPVSAGGDLPLLHAAGGVHHPIGLLATHIDASDLVGAHLEAEVGGVVLATADPQLDFRCDLDAGGLVTWGTLLVYDVPDNEVAALDGQTTTITATVTDASGTEATVTSDFVIRDRP